MSLHQTNNVKEPTDNNNQATIHPGENQKTVACLCRRPKRRFEEINHTAAVKRALGAARDSVKPFLSLLRHIISNY